MKNMQIGALEIRPSATNALARLIAIEQSRRKGESREVTVRRKVSIYLLLSPFSILIRFSETLSIGTFEIRPQLAFALFSNVDCSIALFFPPPAGEMGRWPKQVRTYLMN